MSELSLTSLQLSPGICPKIMLVGDARSGKSALGNLLLGQARHGSPFDGSPTKLRTDALVTGYWLADRSRPVRIVDTAAATSSGGGTSAWLAGLMAALEAEGDGRIDCVVVVRKEADEQVGDGPIVFLKLLEMLYGGEVWRRVAFAATAAPKRNEGWGNSLSRFTSRLLRRPSLAGPQEYRMTERVMLNKLVGRGCRFTVHEATDFQFVLDRSDDDEASGSGSDPRENIAAAQELWDFVIAGARGEQPPLEIATGLSGVWQERHERAASLLKKDMEALHAQNVKLEEDKRDLAAQVDNMKWEAHKELAHEMTLRWQELEKMIEKNAKVSEAVSELDNLSARLKNLEKTFTNCSANLQKLLEKQSLELSSTRESLDAERQKNSELKALLLAEREAEVKRSGVTGEEDGSMEILSQEHSESIMVLLEALEDSEVVAEDYERVRDENEKLSVMLASLELRHKLALKLVGQLTSVKPASLESLLEEMCRSMGNVTVEK